MNTLISKKLPSKKLKSYKLTTNSYQLSASRNLKPRLIVGQATTPSHRRAGYNPASSARKLQPLSYLFPPKKLQAKKLLQSGFTLVEMLVSISVFLVVMLVAASSLLSIIDGNAKAQSLKSAINNLNFALESMQKNIRVGKDYPTSSGSIFQFTSYQDSDNTNGNDTIIYKLIGESIKRCVVIISNNCSGDEKFTTITAPEVHIDYLNFYLSISGTENPRVLIVVGGYAGEKERIKTKFNLQTTVSQRPF